MRSATAAGLTSESVVQIECTLRDALGAVAGGDLVVTAAVEGGELLGVENGDLADNTRYGASRQTFDGRVIVFVRPNGSTTVQLSARGLSDVTVAC